SFCVLCAGWLDISCSAASVDMGGGRGIVFLARTPQRTAFLCHYGVAVLTFLDSMLTTPVDNAADRIGARHVLASDPADFSIVLGGPLSQLLRRAPMTGNALELLRRRVFVIAAIGWLPLVLLTVLGGNAIGTAVSVPFLKDVEVHARFLLAVPLLVIA